MFEADIKANPLWTFLWKFNKVHTVITLQKNLWIKGSKF